MTEYIIQDNILEDIADAIREKNNNQTTYYPSEMATAIQQIDTSGYPEPTGTITISQNGTANVKDYATATVNVQPNLQQKTATQNGTVTPDSGYDGLSSVVVDVSGGGSCGILGGFTMMEMYVLIESTYVMRCIKTANAVDFEYLSGSRIGAHTAFVFDLTNIATIKCDVEAHPGEYSSAYSTPRYSPILLITKNQAYDAFPINTSIVSANGETYRLTSNTDMQTFIADVSSLTGSYWIVFSCIGCTATFSNLEFEFID